MAFNVGDLARVKDDCTCSGDCHKAAGLTGEILRISTSSGNESYATILFHHLPKNHPVTDQQDEYGNRSGTWNVYVSELLPVSASCQNKRCKASVICTTCPYRSQDKQHEQNSNRD